MAKKVSSVLPSSQNELSSLFGQIDKIGIQGGTSFDYSQINPYVKAGDSPTEITSSYSAEELNSAGAFNDYEYKKYKYQNQSTWDKVANSIIGGVGAGLARAGENVSYLPETIHQFIDPRHGVEGNFLADWFNEKASDITEELMPIYMDPDKKGITDQDWNVMFFKGVQSIIDSTLGFAIPGTAIMKGLGALGKASKLAKIAATLGSIESESVVVNNFNKLMNTLAADANYQRAIHQGLGGLITNDLEGTAMATQSYKENVASLKKARAEGRLDESWDDNKIEQFAADRAWDFKNTNRLLAIQDMWALGGIAKGLNSARGRLEKSTWSKFIDPFTDKSTAKKILERNFGEMAEEMIQGGFESEAKYQTDLITGDAKKSDKGYFGRILQGSTTKDAWYEGVMGWFGGGMQSMLTNTLDMAVSKNYWDNQKKRLEDQNNFLNESSAKIKNDIKGLAGTQRKIEEHLKNGDDTAALVQQDMAFLNLASEHFRRGTTEHLERNIQSALADPNLSPEDKKSYQSLLEKLATYENIYNKYSGYANQQELFDNEVTQNANVRLLDALKMQQVTALEELRNGPLYRDKNWKNISENVSFWDPSKSNDLISYFESLDAPIKNTTQFQKLKSLNEKINEGEEYLKGLKNESETLKSFKSNEFTKTKSSFLYNMYKKNEDRAETEWLNNAKKELDIVAEQNNLDAEEKENISDELEKMHQRANLRKMFDLMEETRKKAENQVQKETQRRDKAEENGEQVDENNVNKPAIEINFDAYPADDSYTGDDEEGFATEKNPQTQEEVVAEQDPNQPKGENLNEKEEKDAETAKDNALVSTPPIEFKDNSPEPQQIKEVKNRTENDFNPETVDKSLWDSKESLGFTEIEGSSDKPKTELDRGKDEKVTSNQSNVVKVRGSTINFRIQKGKVVVDKTGRAVPVDSFDDNSPVQDSIDLLTMGLSKKFNILDEEFTLTVSSYGAEKKPNIVIHRKSSGTRIGTISVSNNPDLYEKIKNAPNQSITTKMSSFYQALAVQPTADSPFRQLSELNLTGTTIGIMTDEGLKLPDGQLVRSFQPTNKNDKVPIGSIFMIVNSPRGQVYLPLRYSKVGEVKGMNQAIISAIVNSEDVSNTIEVLSRLVKYMDVPSITVSSRKYKDVLKNKAEELIKQGKKGSFLFSLKSNNGIPTSLGLITITGENKYTFSYSTRNNINTFIDNINKADFKDVMTSTKSKSFTGTIDWNGQEITYLQYLTKIAKTNLTPIRVRRKDSNGTTVENDVFHIVQTPIFEIELEPKDTNVQEAPTTEEAITTAPTLERQKTEVEADTKELPDNFDEEFELNIDRSIDSLDPNDPLDSLAPYDVDDTEESNISNYLIGNLTYLQQDTIVKDLINEISAIIASNDSSISEANIKDLITESYINELQKRMDKVEQLQNFDQSKLSESSKLKVTVALEDNSYAVQQLNNVLDNFDAFFNYALNEIENSDLFNVERDSEAFQKSGDDSDPSFSEERHFTVNPKLQISKELKVFLHGITKKDSNGKDFQNFLGKTSYMSFNEVFNIVKSLLADEENDFDTIIEVLTEASEAHPFLISVVEKLKGATEQIKNQFISQMPSHLLNMKYVYISKSMSDESTNYKVSVADTNTNSIHLELESRWRNNQHLAPIFGNIKNGDYPINIEKLNRLKELLNTWNEDIASIDTLPSFDKFYSDTNYSSVYTPINFGGDNIKYLVDILSNHSESFVKTGEVILMTKNGPRSIRRIPQGSSTYFPKDYTGENESAKSSAKIVIEDANILSFNEENIKEFFNIVGIDLSQGTIEQITKKGFINPKYRKGSEEKYYTGISGAFNDGTIIHHISRAISNLDENSSLIRDGIELFTNNNSLKKLIKQEVMFNKNIGVNTFRSGEKSIYSYTAKKLITDRVKEILNKSEYDILKQLPFNGTSLYLRYLHLNEKGQEFANDNFRDAIGEVIHTDLNALAVNIGKGVNKSGKVNSLSETELEAFMLAMYFNNHRDRDASKIVGNYRIAKYLFQTLSDKSTGIVTTGLAKAYSFPKSSDPEQPLPEMVDDLYEWVFMPELKRLLAQIKLQSSQDFKADKYLSGASQFLILPELNTLEVEVEGKKFNLLQFLNMSPDIITEEDLPQVVIDRVKENISSFIKSKVDEKMEKYQNEFIVRKGQSAEFRLIDTQTMNSSGFNGDAETKLRRMYFEYETNAIINYVENMKLYSGDPAMDYKGNVTVQRMTKDNNTYVKYVVKKENGKFRDATLEDFKQSSQATFAESTKRMAGMIAPGARLANAINNNYIQVYINDYKKESSSIDYFKKLFKDDPKSLKAYSRIEAADAQEFTTWQEHIYVLNGLGKIELHRLGLTTQDLEESKNILTAYEPGKKLTDEQSRLLKRVFQPLKPVVTGFEYSQANEAGKVLRPVYIKTSSFPLIPYLTQGLEIDKLRVAMEKLQEKSGKTVRASFNTGNKRGVRANSLDLYEDPTNLSKIKDNLEIDERTYLVLNRKNFRIQLEKPFKSEKKDSIDHIKRGTQPSKQIFSDEVLTTEVPFDIKGLESLFVKFSVNFNKSKNSANGFQLLTLYKEIFREVYKQNRNDLLRDLNISIGLDNRLDYSTLNLSKLSELLQEELKTSGSVIRLQDKDALQINSAGLFNMDLSFTGNSNKYEAALNALINNRVLKILMPGYSYNLGSELGFNSSNPEGKYIEQSSEEYKGIQDRIIWTSKYNGSSLQSANPKNGFKHQVIIPSKFRKEVSPGKWELIDLVKDGFVIEKTKEDGTKILTLDESKFSPELLEIFGYRVPSSGMNTMASIEIAGFLPVESGDLAIATADFIVKMGSDFDADSLYSYMYYHKLNEEDKLVKDDDILSQELAERNSDLDKKSLINALIKIHHSVLTNPDSDIQRNAARPLGFDYASESAKKLASLPETATGKSFRSAIGTEYQKEQMIGAAAGKTGVGLFSLDVTSHATFQQTLPKQKIRLKNGKEVRLFGFIGKDLGRVRTLDGSRKISQVHEEYQNLTLDSAKDLSLMNNLGVNDYTFSMFKAVNELGFDKVKVVINGEETTLPIGGLLANHPAVKAYIRDLKNNDSSSKEDTKSTIAILNSHMGNLTSLRPKELLAKFEELKQQDFVGDIQKLKDQDFFSLANSEEDEDIETTLDKTQIERGRLAVALFNHFSNIGKAIGKIQGAFNTDSKLLDKSLFLNMERWEVYQELTDPEAREKSMFDNIQYLENSIGGYAATMGLKLSTELYSKVFPVIHNRAVREGALNRIVQIVGKEDYSMESKAKMKYYIYSEFKKFIYANSAVQNLGDTNLRTIRKAMFFDFFEDGKRKSESLASYVKNNLKSGKLPLQLFNSLEYNIFENEVNPDIDLTEQTGNSDEIRTLNQLKFHKSINQPSTISLNVNTKGEKVNSLYLIFNEMLNDETPLPSWNGEEMTRQRLAQYLVLYSFLEGGVQEATQFTSLVPVKYLVDFGIAKNIQTFLNSDSWGDRMAIDAFVDQYFQHNPNRAITLNDRFVKEIQGRNSVFSNIVPNSPAEGYNIKLSNEDSPDNYPEYVKMIKTNPATRINTARKYYKVNTLLFKRSFNPDGSIDYLPMPIKGVNGMNEFTSNIGEDNNSLIFRNQLGVKTRARNTIAYGTISSVVNDLLSKDKKDIVVSNKSYKGIAISKNDFYKILNEIKDPTLKRFIDATVTNANLNDVNIYLLDSTDYIAKAIPSENVIAFSRGLFSKERLDIETAISEEYFHILTAITIRNNQEYFGKVDNIRTKAITNFYERNKKNFADKNLSLETFLADVSKLDARNTYSYVKGIMFSRTKPETITKLANILYSFSRVEEIAARGLVHKDTRDFLNKIKLADNEKQGTKNESLFIVLRNLIKDLFKSVFNIREDSLLEDMISVMMEYQDNLFDAKSVVDPFADLLENKLPLNPESIFGTGSNVEKFLYETLGYLNKVEDLMAIDKITYTDKEGNFCISAKEGLVTPQFTKGGQWSIIKDLKGYPLHKDGGVDLVLSKEGVKIKDSETEFVAAKGLVMPSRKC